MRSTYGWFDTEGVSPSSNLRVVDLSGFIPENAVPSPIQETDSIMYADEFGVLRYATNDIERNQYKHSPIVNSPEVSVTNKLLHSRIGPSLSYFDKNYTNRIPELTARSFIHSYYVSKFFTIQSSTVSLYTGLEDSIPLISPDNLAIKVVDDFGDKHVDSNGVNKYEIILEKYSRDSSGVSRNDSFYRIIVLLEESDPKNLSLVYDKFEISGSGVPINQFLGYKEKINTTPYYDYVVEESEVVDFSSESKRIYSTQLFSHKENRILTHKNDVPGWKTIVPRKAFQDPRTFESFSYRLAAKIVYDYSSLRNIYADEEQPIVHCAVINSSGTSNLRFPFVFSNMENYPLNTLRFSFENPASNISDKSNKDYWSIDITSPSILQYDFDILYWAPTAPITEVQASVINALLNKKISVFIDCGYLLDTSTAANAGLNHFNINYSITSDSTSYLSLINSYVNGNTTFNAWNMSDFSESTAQLSYGVFGKRKDPLTGSSYPVRSFVTSATADWSSVQNNAIVRLSNNNSVVIKKYPTNAGTDLSSERPAIYFSANQISNLLNDSYQNTGIASATVNNGQTNILTAGITAVNPSIEGAIKFFYNIVSESIRNKVISSRQVTLGQSSDMWFATPWKSSWTINGARTGGAVTVLTPQEKQIYNFSDKTQITTDANASTASTKFCRQIENSISNVLLSNFSSVTGVNSSIINNDLSNVTFYLECTNDSVGFLNFNTVSSTDYFYGNTEAPYYAHELSAAAKNQIVSSNGSTPLTVDAYAKVESVEFNFSGIQYPYMIVDESEYLTNPDSSIQIPKEYLGRAQSIRNYDFDLKTSYSYRKVRELSSNYTVNWQAPFTVNINGTGNVKYLPPAESGLYPLVKSIKDVKDSGIPISNKNSPFYGYYYPTKAFSRTDILAVDQDKTDNVYNNFHYTGDIPISKKWDEYRVGYTSTSGGSSGTTTVTTVNKPTGNPFKFLLHMGTRIGTLEKSQATFFADEIMTRPAYVSKYSGEDVADFYIQYENWFRSNVYNPELFGDLNEEQYFQTFLTTRFNDEPGVKVGGRTYGGNVTGWRIVLESFVWEYENLMVYPKQADSFNSFSSSSSGSSSSTTLVKNEYVKYIQYTLNEINNEVSTSMKFIPGKLAVDGAYGQATKNAIKLFQKNKKQSFIDGIVDSETKSVLAQYWIELKRYFPGAFDIKLSTIKNENIKAYINAAVRYSDISAIGTTEYRRISFTGTKGPTEIKDYLIVKVPEECVELKEVLFTTGKWNTIIKNIYLYDKNLYSENSHKIPGVNYSGIRSVFSKKVDVNLLSESTLHIDTGGRRGIKYVMFELVGDAVGGLGPNAEGFSVANIQFDMMVEQAAATIQTETGAVRGVGTGVMTGTTVISTGQFYQLALNGGLRSIIASNSNTQSTITQMYLEDIRVVSEDLQNLQNVQYPHPLYYSGSGNKLYVYNNSSIQNMGAINYAFDSNTNFNLSLNDTSGLSVTSAPSVTSAFKVGAPTVALTNSDFEISAMPSVAGNYIVNTKINASFEVETRSSEIIKLSDLDYHICDADDVSKPLRKIPQTISAIDGIVLLTDANRNPIGFPNFASITPANATESVSFGFINLLWNHDTLTEYSYGLRWEFYNRLTKRFYGKKLSYLDYEAEKNNIYIALLAYDADGESSTRNILGGDSYMLSLSQLPNKTIAPLYSLKSVTKQKIGVYPPPNDLSKFDSWFIGVGSGKFFKNITIPNYNYSNFLRNHNGKTLRCLYDTTGLMTNTSSVFGSGYYDVWEEHPILIAENVIKVRHGTFHIYQKQLNKTGFDDKYTDANVAEPWMTVEIKNTTTGIWSKIDPSLISSYDKHTGNVMFKQDIVPSDPQNIRVSYVVKNSNIVVRHVNGKEIPLNPFSPTAKKIDKPIYIYVLPTQVEYNVNNAYLIDSNYSVDNIVNWTDKYDIFDISKAEYNPLALHIGTINVINSYSFEDISFLDLRVKGGGISGTENPAALAKVNNNILSFADIYSGKGYIYPNGGYVIVRIPKEVKDHFTSEEELYSIIRSNLTAGVSFDVQDMDGNDWRTV